MKTMYKTLLAVFCCVFAGGYCASGAEDVISKSMKVAISNTLSPQARTTGTAVTNSSSAKDKWVQVDVKFNTPDVKDSWLRYLDDAELEVKLAVYPANEKEKEKEKSVVFSGKVSYWFVEQDGREHYMKVLLPAVFFRRYTENRAVERVLFVAKAALSFGGKQRAVAYGSTKNLQEKDITAFFRTPPANTIFINDTLIGRHGTPWSVIEVNKFEFEKQPWLSDVRLEPKTKDGKTITPPANSNAGKNKKTKKNK